MDRPLSFYSFFQVFKLARFPNLFIIAFAQYLTAIFLTEGQSSLWSVIGDVNLSLVVLSTTMIAPAGYLINDYYDIKIDMVNKPNKVIVGNKLERRQVLIWHTIFNVSGITLGCLVSIWIGVVNLVATFLLWIYSNQLKRLPLLGNITVALLTGMSLLVLAIYFRSNNYIIFTYAFFAFGITLIREIIKDIEDMKGDEVYGCKTLPIILGIRKTKWILYILISCFAFSLYAFTYQLESIGLTTYFLLLLVPSLYLFYKLIKSDSKQHFNHLSQYCKWLMIGGILSMTVLK